MTTTATITRDGRDVLSAVPVDIELDDPRGHRWSGVFEAGEEWPIDLVGSFRLHLPDGRCGTFVPTRQCGRDLGTTVVIFQGAEPLGARSSA